MVKIRIGIVAGEPSGDLLGSEIVLALRRHYPEAEFIGVAGPKMLAAGVQTLFPLEKLSVMGFTEVLMRVRELLQLRKQVKKYFIANPPDVYIGVDAPDFNLPVELALKRKKIKTVHCNSPTIWAWRENRVFKIKKAVDLMLALFPFEPKYYEKANIPVKYIGHPLADLIPVESKPLPKEKIIALMPGSRNGEISYIGPILLRAAKLILQKHPDAKFISPMANQSRAQQFEEQYKKYAPELSLKITIGNTREVMESSRVIALASGTATLEGMLVKRSMVVTYKGSVLSYWIARMLIKIPYVSLPNILAGEMLIPEYLQYQATPENIAKGVLDYLDHPEKTVALQKRFAEIHKTLRCGAAEKAAEAVAYLCQ